MLKINLETSSKYVVVMELLDREYSINFYELDTLANFIEIERNVKNVYRVQIICLPVGVYTRKTNTSC